MIHTTVQVISVVGSGLLGVALGFMAGGLVATRFGLRLNRQLARLLVTLAVYLGDVQLRRSDYERLRRGTA